MTTAATLFPQNWHDQLVQAGVRRDHAEIKRVTKLLKREFPEKFQREALKEVVDQPGEVLQKAKPAVDPKVNAWAEFVKASDDALLTQRIAELMPSEVSLG
jgi:hypothetical protein